MMSRLTTRTTSSSPRVGRSSRRRPLAVSTPSGSISAMESSSRTLRSCTCVTAACSSLRVEAMSTSSSPTRRNTSALTTSSRSLASAAIAASQTRSPASPKTPLRRGRRAQPTAVEREPARSSRSRHRSGLAFDLGGRVRDCRKREERLLEETLRSISRRSSSDHGGRLVVITSSTSGPMTSQISAHTSASGAPSAPGCLSPIMPR